MDGKDGPTLKRELLRGADALILAYVRVTRSKTLHEVELISFQVKDGSGTVLSRKRNAESTIATIKGAVSDIVEIKKAGGDCHALAWDFNWIEPAAVEMSVDEAFRLAVLAEAELAKGDFCVAAELARNAIEIDACVQLAHEILWSAIATGAPTTGILPRTLKKSRAFLEQRKSRLGHTKEIIKRSLKMVGENIEPELRGLASALTQEHERLEKILDEVEQTVGDLYDTLQDRLTTETIEELRASGVTPEKACVDRRSAIFLAHPSVEFLRGQAVRWEQVTAAEQVERVRRDVNQRIIEKALDPRIRPVIRLIVEHVRHNIRDSLWGRKICPEARLEKRIRDAETLFYAKRGERPTDDELADLVNEAVDKIKAARTWKSLMNADPIERSEWQEPKKKGDPNYPPDGDDPDDEDPGIARKW